MKSAKNPDNWEQKILVVDDKPENLYSMHHALDGIEATIIEANSGIEALSLTLRHEFALILLDVQMPELNGFETASFLRANNKTKNTPIIFVTAIYKDDDHIFKGYQSGAVDLLLKPINQNILISKVKVFLEIHKQKKMLLQSNLRLEQRVNERTIELKTLNSHLEVMIQDRTRDLEKSLHNLKETQNELVNKEKMAALGRMVAGVAHEINTPIGIGITGLSTLIDSYKNINKNELQNINSNGSIYEFLQEAKEISNLVLSQLSIAATLVSDFKQVSVDQSKPDIRRINLKTYFEKIVTTLLPKIKKNKISIQIIAPENIDLVTCPGALSQAITAIILNAITHAFSKKSSLPPHITIEIKDINAQCEISISDNGQGISEDNISKIFDPFFTTNRTNGGSGLGLSISHNIVFEILKGTIYCTSTKHIGTCFTLKLPNLN